MKDNIWHGSFGADYHRRNTAEDPKNPMQSRVMMFDRVLAMTEGVQSVLEFGCGKGENLIAIQESRTAQDWQSPLALCGVEINEDAAAKTPNDVDVFVESMLSFNRPRDRWDMTFTRGVLIHIDPYQLKAAYASLFNHSSRYVMVAEYYSRVPREMPYRGSMGRLWLRDFAGEMMDIYPQLKLLGCGFCYHRDPEYPQDDVTWFLMEKTT